MTDIMKNAGKQTVSVLIDIHCIMGINGNPKSLSYKLLWKDPLER